MYVCIGGLIYKLLWLTGRFEYVVYILRSVRICVGLIPEPYVCMYIVLSIVGHILCYRISPYFFGVYVGVFV